MKYLPSDEVFFSEWHQWRHSKQRGKGRAQALRDVLGLGRALPVPALIVVGSKGKGTAVAAASWRLQQAGLRVGTVTSPPMRSNCERIRIDGKAISEAHYQDMASKVEQAKAMLPDDPEHYLAPTGLFTLGGVAHLLSRGCQALVIEEGLGGLSDEASLFDYPVVATTEVFLEHGDLLGNSVDLVARDLLGVITAFTEAVVSFPQPNQSVKDLLGDVSRSKKLSYSPLTLPSAGKSTSRYTAANLQVGVSAAEALLTWAGCVHRASGDSEAPDLSLPGRGSFHWFTSADGSTQRWMVDAAISPAGIREALRVAEAKLRPGFSVVAGLPDSKQVSQGLAVVDGYPLVLASAGTTHLTYREASQFGRILPVAEAINLLSSSSKNDVMAVGTISFVGEVLEALGAETDRWW